MSERLYVCPGCGRYYFGGRFLTDVEVNHLSIVQVMAAVEEPCSECIEKSCEEEMQAEEYYERMRCQAYNELWEKEFGGR